MLKFQVTGRPSVLEVKLCHLKARIDLGQYHKILDWVDEKGGELVYRAKRQVFCRVYLVSGQALVVAGSLYHPILFCSEKHAQELEKAGIVSFLEVEVVQS